MSDTFSASTSVPVNDLSKNESEKHVVDQEPPTYESSLNNTTLLIKFNINLNWDQETMLHQQNQLSIYN
jgi:hypothetical protein